MPPIARNLEEDLINRRRDVRRAAVVSVFVTIAALITANFVGGEVGTSLATLSSVPAAACLLSMVFQNHLTARIRNLRENPQLDQQNQDRQQQNQIENEGARLEEGPALPDLTGARDVFEVRLEEENSISLNSRQDSANSQLAANQSLQSPAKDNPRPQAQYPNGDNHLVDAKRESVV